MSNCLALKAQDLIRAGFGRYWVMYKGTEMLADCDTWLEAVIIKREAYRQDKKDGTFEKGCYSISDRYSETL